MSVFTFLLLFLPNQIAQKLTKHVQTAARKEDVSSSKLWTDEIFWAMPFSGFPASITELYCMTWWAGPRALLWNPRGASLSSYKLFSNQVCQEWKDRAPLDCTAASFCFALLKGRSPHFGLFVVSLRRVPPRVPSREQANRRAKNLAMPRHVVFAKPRPTISYRHTPATYPATYLHTTPHNLAMPLSTT
jgi:hypothetical protein